jgi:hypothetical protein
MRLRPPGELKMSGGSRWTRNEFLRRAAAGTVVLAGTSGYAFERLAGGGATAEAARAPAGGANVQSFYSRPDLKPPAVTVVRPASGVAPGYLFIAPSSGPGQRGAMILDDAGDVVWFYPTTKTIMNFRAAVYRGKPVLTWWEGAKKTTLVGQHVILDSSYREIERFGGGGGHIADLHEFLITPRNTALVTSYELVKMDLRSLGGPARHTVVGSMAQELELPSGRVLFEWHALRHVALSESHVGVGPKFDYFHINSIEELPDGDWLISARNTWAVYKVDRRTGSGKVLWRLGGKKSDFAMGKGTFFAFQHDARQHADGTLISLFDDGATPKVQSQSHALFIKLDMARKRATLARDYVHNPPLLARYTGSVQELPNGNVLVGWGTEPWFTEYAADGTVRFDAKLPHGGENYRALRFPWVGQPLQGPRLVVHDAGGQTTLYASWNGATQVTAWQLEAGTSPSSLQPGATTPKQGFETALAAPSGASHAAAVALDVNGEPLGRSDPVSF